MLMYMQNINKKLMSMELSSRDAFIREYFSGMNLLVLSSAMVRSPSNTADLNSAMVRSSSNTAVLNSAMVRSLCMLLVSSAMVRSLCMLSVSSAVVR